MVLEWHGADEILIPMELVMDERAGADPYLKAAEAEAGKGAEDIAWYGRPDPRLADERPHAAAAVNAWRRRRAAYRQLAAAALAGSVTVPAFALAGAIPGAFLILGLPMAACSYLAIRIAAGAARGLEAHADHKRVLDAMAYAVTGRALYVMDGSDRGRIVVTRLDEAAIFQVTMGEGIMEGDVLVQVANRTLVMACLRKPVVAAAALEPLAGKIASSVHPA